MTYLVLARKWRPRSFDTLVGQDHVVRALTHALETQRLHHAWLFTGTRGVGKTTLSRILAKSLNCEKGITANPCGECRACTEIDAGRYVDYVELDAASNRGVDEMTQLLEQAVYAPSSARFKVYMIDEVHMLTGHAFNAMLKTLEEPPPHVKFILATTDPQKIPVTVLSRCLQFNLKHMTVSGIVEYLEFVLAQEGLPFEVPALRLLAQAAGGSMRDALSLADQAIAYSAGNLTLEAVQGMLGTIDQRHLVRLLQALAEGRPAGVLAVADELASRGLSYESALADIAVLLSQMAIEQRVPGALASDDPLAGDIQTLAASLHPDLVQLYYSVAVHSRDELSLAPDEYAGFVMACLRMLSLTPEPSGTSTPPPPSEPSGSASVSTPMTSSASSTQSATPGVSASPTPPVSSVPIASEEGTDTDSTVIDAGPDIPAWEAGPGEGGQAYAEVPGTLATEAEEPGAPADDTLLRGPAQGESAAASVEEPVSEPAAESTAESSAASSAAFSAAFSANSIATSSDESSTDAASEAKPANSQIQDDTGAQGDVHNENQAGEHGPLAERLDDDLHAGDPFGEDTIVDDPGVFLDAADWEPVMDDQAVAEAQFAPLLREQATPPPRKPSLARMRPEDWPALAASLPLTGLAAELARQSEWVGTDGDTVTLRVAIWSLAAKQGLARLRTVLTEHFGKVVQVEIQFGETGDATAHAVEQQRRAARQKEAEAAVANDPVVRSLIEEFGARVVPGSIMALDDQSVA